MTTSVVDIGGVKLFDTALFFKDCAWPITDMRRYAAPDEVLANMPVFLGKWATGTTAPSILTHSMEVKTAPVVSDPNCGVATVIGDMTWCYLNVPNMKDLALASEGLKLRELIETYCHTRNVSTQAAETILGEDGQIDMGSPYAFDFARFAYAQVAQALMQLLTASVMNGDYADTFEIDGFYNQLANGWDKPGSNACPDAQNKAQTIDWKELTTAGPGPYTGDAHPDDVTAASKTVTLWGQTYDVPAGLNLAQFIDELWIPAVKAWWTDNLGGVDMWEMHIATAKKRAFIRSAACVQPCNVSGDFDPELRERLQRFISTGVAEFLETRTAFPVLESGYVAADEIWFGPRQIAGKPTYGLFFEDMQGYLNALGPEWGNMPNSAMGLPPNDPLVKSIVSLVQTNFEAVAFQRKLNFQNILCATAEMLTRYGLIVVARHLWLNVKNVTSASFYTAPSANLTITTPP